MLPLSGTDLSSDDVFKLTNQTSLTPDMKALSAAELSVLEGIDTSSDEPLVLILHTHATECYSQSSGESYVSTEPTRCDDTQSNVVAVGRDIAGVLCDFGIKTIHSDVLHDKASFIKAYSASKGTAQWYLEHYPSIRFVIDVHRDAIIRDSGEKIKPVASIAGESCAQLMLVVGSNASGSNHPNWQENLALAAKLQAKGKEMYPSLFRPINLRTSPFNQNLSKGYMLLEVGSCGNSLDEAKRSGRDFAAVLAKVIKSE